MLYNDGKPPVAVGTVNRKAVPKLCGLTPTSEAFEPNVSRAHFQVSQWYSALSGDPPCLNAVDYRWKADGARVPHPTKYGRRSTLCS